MAEPMTDAEMWAIESAYAVSDTFEAPMVRRLLSEVRRLRGELKREQDDYDYTNAELIKTTAMLAEFIEDARNTRARLALHEPEVKDETPVCSDCGTTNCDERYDCLTGKATTTPRWRYLAAQAILNGGKGWRPSTG